MTDSATSVDVEEHLYTLATDLGITVVTSSQVCGLLPIHTFGFGTEQAFSQYLLVFRIACAVFEVKMSHLSII